VTAVRPLPVATLHGQHVRLEPLTLEHVPGLVAAATGGPRDSYAYTWVPADTEDATRYVEAALAEQAAGRALPFATIYVQAAMVVGSTRFGTAEHWAWPTGSPYRRPEGLPDVVEIGWTWLAAHAQRTPINTEAKLLMLGHAFETWRVHRVTLKTDVRNVGSQRAIERLGARKDGVLRAHMPAYDGAIRDTVFYSILAPEWPEIKARLSALL